MHFGIFFRRTDHFEIEADLFHRERDVLVGLHLDLRLEFAFAQVARHLDDLGDRRVAAHGNRAILAARACAFRGAAHGIADGLRIDDRFFVDRVGR